MPTGRHEPATLASRIDHSFAMTTSAAALLLMSSLAALSSTKALAACPAGIYGEATHERVVVTDTPQGATAQRYVFVDGRRGGVGAADALLRCTAEGLQVRGGGGGAEDWQTWPRIDYRQTALRFKSQGSELAGMLIEPPDAATTRPPLTVHVHGSKRPPL